MTHIPSREQCKDAEYHLKSAAEQALLCWHIDGDYHPKQVAKDFAKAAEALGFALVPLAVTDKPGFDNRDGGRMHETSSAQEG